MIVSYSKEIIANIIVNFCLGKYKFIYISGNGGAGKTTLSQQLGKEINSMGLAVNCIDMERILFKAQVGGQMLRMPRKTKLYRDRDNIW